MTAVQTSTNETYDLLKSKMDYYQTSNLTGISATDFEAALRSRISVVDSDVEGYSPAELEKQRDLSIKYHWGHTHDFGTFELVGRMGYRHLELMQDFIDLFPVSFDSFEQKDVLDVGCWTGGTTLLLAAFANSVLAVEEVKKYAETVSFLAQSFGIADRVESQSLSIYLCNNDEFMERFDLVYFPGVVYHLSDPVVGLRILFNSLKIGGEILVESAGVDSAEPVCRFEGNSVYHTGRREDLSRGGWNWFLPSPSALELMMREAGFDEVQTTWHPGRKRVFAHGRKTRFVGICRAGLSVPDLK